ncbi:uncharacterized protein LOC107657414 [Sinocyclocheilus anshuiensis]|uniref:uncharacterized protein LOC107657414 n=1 Tax=Sinocyclocheilus anshuiensis TaxID=1608454 RepID=UPI0007B82CC3|nr:PREDICTED: uncharacterized protein LOC107657414 [Sinocyclocheilus anshuiensis]
MISAADDVHQHSRSSIIMETNYFWSSKRIPEELPVDLTTAEKPVPENFEPLEVQCPYCPGPSPPDLGNKILITRQATVYGIFKQFKGVSVFAKECPVCRNLVRFQEYESGFHNYNNRIFLSIPLCSLLTAGVSNHIAVGRLFRTIESHSRTALPINMLRKAFYHFSALRQYSYNFFCYRCGYHPSIVIAAPFYYIISSQSHETPGHSEYWPPGHPR